MAYMSPDPLSANWSYDSAIDLFSLNTMVPESFPLDIPNDMLWDPKDLPSDFFAAPADINGFTVSNHEDSLSSDLESDDQSYSPTNIISTPPTIPADLASPVAFQPQPKRKSSTTTRYSSSPELHPQLPPPATSITTSISRKRSINNTTSDDHTTRTRNAAKRAAHNIIEKRYRTNMNAKFLALEKAMSGAKATGVQKPSSSSSTTTSPTSTSGGKSSGSLKKSEILTNAIAYMQELQETNERLRKEVAALSQGLGRRVYC